MISMLPGFLRIAACQDVTPQSLKGATISMAIFVHDMAGKIVLAAARQKIDQPLGIGGRDKGVGAAVAAAKFQARAEYLVSINLQVLIGLCLFVVEHEMQFLLERQERDFQPPAFVGTIHDNIRIMGVLVVQCWLAQVLVDAFDRF